MRLLVARWTRASRAITLTSRSRNIYTGRPSAIAALALGVGDLSILGEEILPRGGGHPFERMRPYPPFGVDLATGSVDVRNFDYAQMFFVHQDNPLSRSRSRSSTPSSAPSTGAVRATSARGAKLTA